MEESASVDTWSARYREGYVDAEGDWVELDNALVPHHGWGTPEQALACWQKRGDFAQAGVTRFGNGKQQLIDVTGRPGFTQAGATHIWRRITFEQT